MMKRSYIISACFIYVCICIVNGQQEYFEAFPSASKKEFMQILPELLANTEVPEETVPFVSACPSIPLPPDTNDVNNLRPGNIKVLMSMGDSITAAMSAKDTNILNLHEYRGLSFPIGTDPGVMTFANLLKQYSPPGYPLGTSTGIGKRTMSTNGLNAAVSGAINSDMLGQAEWLVAELKANSKINMAKDWKVVTIWIGSNNICQVCNDAVGNNAVNYEKHIYAALDYFYTHVPRLFVNLLAILDITKIYDINNGLCSILHPNECPCPSSRNANVRQTVKAVISEYVHTANIIAANYTARKNPEFAVVVQPFLVDSPIYNRTYLSAADCFHPSAIAHEAAGIALWNSIITPIAKKPYAWDPAQPPLCATSESLLYTH